MDTGKMRVEERFEIEEAPKDKGLNAPTTELKA